MNIDKEREASEACADTTPIGVFVSIGTPSVEMMAAMDKKFQDWTLRAARGECSWVCADCCMSFVEGMPDACAHGHQNCTEIIQRDKQDALRGKS